MKKNFLLIILLVFMMIGCVSEGLRQTYGDEWMEANSDWRREDEEKNTRAVLLCGPYHIYAWRHRM